jgi:hypothetical protein
MKYNNTNKEIIQMIENGTIFDIPSFVSYKKQRKLAKIDKAILVDQFEKEIPIKRYYYPANLRIDPRNLISENEYERKVKLHEVNPESYKSVDISLRNDAGIKKHVVDKRNIMLDFYNGIYISESFNDIYEFLILWQHLKNEMLIQECSCDNYVDTLGLFYKPKNIRPEILDTPTTELIEYTSCTISDKCFLDQDYVFFNDAYLRCKDYIGKKIYPSIHLSLFVKNNFETDSEIAQRKSMRVAWIAILVSIILAVFPYINDYLQPDDTDPILNQIHDSLLALEMKTEQICNLMETNNALHEGTLENDDIVNALQSIIEEMLRFEENLTNDTHDIPGN